MTNETQEMTVAKIILAQLGGGRFIAMTGARNFLGDSKSLTFRLPRAAAGITHVRVTLTPADEYEVEFLKIRGTKAPVTVKTVDGVQVSNLREVFTEATGFLTSL